jgi:predicted permease
VAFSVFAQVLLPIVVVVAGDAAVPLLLIILGLQLAETGWIGEAPRVALATVLRLGLSVPLALLLAHLLGLNELSTRLTVMLSSMPTAVNVTILAIEFDVRPRFVSSVVVVFTVASVLSLTSSWSSWVWSDPRRYPALLYAQRCFL